MSYIEKQNNRETGKHYEQKAMQYLEEKGYNILETNFRTRFGEIDIIARDGNIIVFIEIKYRRTSRCGYPRESVTKQKQQKIRQVASFYLVQKKSYEKPLRFDVIEYLGEDITHIQNAF
ncbi:MAG: YraN family protein [Cellulosilyticaceae bacterium]